jgi:hypothetical protein
LVNTRPESSSRSWPPYSGLNIVGGLGDPAVQLAHLTDQVHRQCTQRLAGGIAGSRAAQEFSGVIGAQVAPGTTGNQAGEHHVQSVHRLGASLHQVIAVLHDGAQRRGFGVGFGSVQRA